VAVQRRAPEKIHLRELGRETFDGNVQGQDDDGVQRLFCLTALRVSSVLKKPNGEAWIAIPLSRSWPENKPQTTPLSPKSPRKESRAPC
jgi:hypothetical protein